MPEKIIWIYFPKTKEEIQEALNSIGVEGRNSDFELTSCLMDFGIEYSVYSLPKNAHIDELNYLAVIMESFDDEEWLTVFKTALDSEFYPQMKDIINIANNLDCFELQPAFTPQDYGEFLLENHKAMFKGVMERLWDQDRGELSFQQYIERLEACADPEAYAKYVINEEKGEFTENGYLTRKEFENIYTGIEDVPEDFRVFAYPEPKPEPSFTAHGITNDAMLGRFLYENNMLSGEQLLLGKLQLKFYDNKYNYFQMLGNKRRVNQNGVFTESGYVEYNKTLEKQSVLKRISAAKEQQESTANKPEKETGKNKKSER